MHVYSLNNMILWSRCHSLHFFVPALALVILYYSYNFITSSIASLIAFLASNSFAILAPPIKCTDCPAATNPACNSLSGSCPAQMITLSTSNIFSFTPTVICNP